MPDVVIGRKMVLEIWRNTEYKTVACLQEASLRVSTEMVVTTTADSGAWDFFKPRISNWGIVCSGVYFIRNLADTNQYMAHEFINLQARQDGLDIRLKWTDEGGQIRYFIGFVYIPETVINKISTGLTKWNVEFIGSGGYTENPLYTPDAIPGEAQDPLYLAVVAGESTVSDPLLINASVVILRVARSGITHTEVASTPGNMEFSFNSGTGTISFDPTNPFNAGEIIYVFYRI